MARVKGNPSNRTLTDVSRDSHGNSSNVGSQAQPVRPDDYDDSRMFDRRRQPEDRPPLDRDPLIRM